MRLQYPVLLAIATIQFTSGQTYSISTFAGGALPGNTPGIFASLYGPESVTVDTTGNIYFADYNDVFRLDATTGVLTLVAGNGTQGFSGDNGAANTAQLSRHVGVAVDAKGIIYIADTYNYRIRQVLNGVITTVAGGGSSTADNISATNALLNNPYGVAVDSAGNIYIADGTRVRKVSNGVITTVAGNGTQGFSGDNGLATNAQLNSQGIALDAAGNLYIADTGNGRVRKVSNGTITTVAGNGTQGFSGDNGPATGARLNNPQGVWVDTTGNLYVADTFNNRIRMISNGAIVTLAGDGPTVLGSTAGVASYNGDNIPGPSASLAFPGGVAVGPDGSVYIADTYNGRVRKVSGGVITTVAGGGAALGDNGGTLNAQLNTPLGVAVDSAGNVYLADSLNNRVRKISNGLITTVAGLGPQGFSGDGGAGPAANLNSPEGVASDSFGNVYIADTGNNRIRKLSQGVITTVAGTGIAGFSGDNGPAVAAELNAPTGVAVDSAGNLYIADQFRVRRVSSGIITTVAGTGTPGFSGDGGPAIGAQLNGPTDIAVDAAGNLYIADSLNNRIREISNGAITTVAGNGTSGFSGDGGPAASAQLSTPSGVAIDSAGTLYIADTLNSRIRKVAGGVVTTIAGGASGFSGDGGPALNAQIGPSYSIAVDSALNLYVADTSNNRIRLLTPGTPPFVLPNGVIPVNSSVPVIQPGSWVSVYGRNLANASFVWNADFPTSLGSTTVTVNGKPAYLWLVSPTQINMQAPDDTTTGMVSVVVSTPFGTAASTATLAPYGPSFNLLGDGRHVAGEILTPNGTGAYGGGSYDLEGPANAFSYSTRPAKPGETLVLYGVGFGPTNPAVPAGHLFSGVAPTVNPVTISIGGVNANVTFSAITEAGLYQFNLTVPTNAGSGDQPVVATINGVQTPAGVVVTLQ